MKSNQAGLSIMAGSTQSGQADRVELQNPHMAGSEELGHFFLLSAKVGC